MTDSTAPNAEETPEPPRRDIAEPWDDPDDEYAVLADLVIPTAQESFNTGGANWAALETKALGILAVVAGAIAVLVTVHQDVNELWWIPAIVIAIAGGLMVAAIWPRDFHFGPDFLDFHYELRNMTPLDAARELLLALVGAIRENDARLNSKITLFWWGLGLLLVGLLASLPVVLVRPD